MIIMFSLIILLLQPIPQFATSYKNEKYIIRQLWPNNDCAGTAAVAHAIELKKCFPNIDDSPLSIEYSVDGDNFISSTWLDSSKCEGNPFKLEKTSISSKCQAAPSLSIFTDPNLQRSFEPLDSSSYVSFLFTDNIPDATIGYPYLQTNYSANVCNTSQFNIPILFHQDSLNTCLRAATLAYPTTAKAITIVKKKMQTGFSVEYYSDTSCDILLSTFQCPTHCTLAGSGPIPTSVSCMHIAGIVKHDNASMVFIAIVCLIGVLGLGYAIFVYMRRRAEYDPSSFGQWVPTADSGSNSYSTFN
jgi:hypothetical protein